MIANGIVLSALPELSAVELTDQFYIFTNRNGGYEMQSVTFDQLSSYVYPYSILSLFNEKYEELKRLSKELIEFIDQNYPNASYINSHYMKIGDFNKTVDGIITTDDAISVFLDEYASKNYINYTKSKILKEHEKIRSDYIKDLSKSTLQNIEISYSSNEEE